jgi:hypothetical protein
VFPKGSLVPEGTRVHLKGIFDSQVARWALAERPSLDELRWQPPAEDDTTSQSSKTPRDCGRKADRTYVNPDIKLTFPRPVKQWGRDEEAVEPRSRRIPALMDIPVTSITLPARATSGQVTVGTLSTETHTTPSSSARGVCVASNDFTVRIANVPSTTDFSGMPPLEINPQATDSAERTAPPLLFLQHLPPS